MSEFSAKELHDLVDRALGTLSEPYSTPEVKFPQFSYLEIDLIEKFYNLLVQEGIDSKIRDNILANLRAEIADPSTSKISLEHLRNRIANCKRCVEASDSSRSSLGNLVDPKILFILAASGGNDLKQFTELVSKFDFDKNACGITYVTRCPLAANITESAINNCSDYLFAEIDYLHPEILVPVGAIPLRVLVGKTHNLADAHGQMFWMGMFRVFPLFSPIYADKANKHAVLESDLDMLKSLL